MSTLSDIATHTRASSATYVDANGTMQTAAINEPRVGHHIYNGSAWVDEGYLHESEARTNLAENSNGFNTASWSLFDGTDTLTSAAAVSPDGSANAWLFAPDNTNGVHILRNPHTFTENTTYTISVFIKASGRRYIQLVFGGQTLGLPSYDYRRGVFDLNDGTVHTDPTDGDAQIQAFGNGWYRCSVIVTTASFADPAEYEANLDIYHADTTNPTSNTISDGNGTDGILIYGAQLEAGSTPSSYIPTAGAEVTRAADAMTIPAANLPWNPLAVSIQMEGTMTYADTDTVRALNFYYWFKDNNDSIRTDLWTTGSDTGEIYFEQEAGGTLDRKATTDNPYTPGINVPFNIASRHGSTFINGAVDGTALTANTTPVALPDLSSTDMEIAPDFMGNIGQVRVWADDLGDTGIAGASE